MRGLPDALPDGEQLLWQGAPRWRTLTLRTFHVRKLAIYFAVLLAWFVASEASSEVGAASVARETLLFAGLAVLPLGLITLYAWLTARSTVYTLTDRRLVIRFGIALPASVNIPFTKIELADLRIYADGTGDIPLRLAPSERIAYLLLWPHVRPWRMARAEPTLRAVDDAGQVAQMLARALAACADLPARVALTEPVAVRGLSETTATAAAA